MASITRAVSSARLGSRGRLLSAASYHAAAHTSSTSSPVATTSKVTLNTTIQFSHRQPVSTYRRTLMTTRNDLKGRNVLNSSQDRSSRGMATITRQPESPEEPEVFSGSEPPSIILTDRAIQVSTLRQVALLYIFDNLILFVTKAPCQSIDERKQSRISTTYLC